MENWTRQQRIFQEWLASPVREPRTQKELAAQLGVSPSRLSEWKQLPGWHEAVNTLMRDSVKEYVPQLVKWAYHHAINGKFQYWAALMRMAGYDIDGNQATGGLTQFAIVFGDGAGVSVSDFTVAEPEPIGSRQIEQPSGSGWQPDTLWANERTNMNEDDGHTTSNSSNTSKNDT